ncbi:transcriptional regulator [Pseudomonas cavernicola]|uniref:Transcriptional regulator n=1 Tax=Pseudomonas cavernicola TaxID=2320866 RepID=A0A418X8C9_9PSED|nr:transcriptional regulator [Pseudomonas cavernicola]RJG08701.1 transcriptional regulator [Pseudomonas cavernicola]
MNTDAPIVTPASPIELITINELGPILLRSRSGVDKLRAKDPTFPKPLKDGTGRQARVYFVRAEVEAWLRAKLDARAE